MAPKLGELFSSLLDEKADEVLNAASVISCDIDSEKRRLTLKLESNSYIKSERIANFKGCCINALKLKAIDVEVEYSEGSFCLEALLDIVQKVQKTSALYSGYLNRAEYA